MYNMVILTGKTTKHFNVSNFTNNHLITTHYYFDGTDSVKNMLEFNK